MKYILILIGGLIAGLLLGGGIIYLVMSREKESLAQKDAEIYSLKKSITDLTAQGQVLEEKFTASQDAQAQLESRIMKLQSQLAQAAPAGPAVTETSEIAGPDDRKLTSPENMRRYAKAMIKAYAARDSGKEDAIVQATFLEMMAEMARIMARYNMPFDPNRAMGEEMFKVYGIPEIRQWYVRLGAAMFEDLGLPLTEVQISAVDRAMLASSERYKAIDNPEFTRLEKAIVLSKFQAEQDAEFARIFTDEQNRKLPNEVAGVMVGRSERSTNVYTRVDSASKTVSDCSGAVLKQWSRDFRLDDTEKQDVKYLSDMYVAEYAGLKYNCESECGKEFMDFYLQRYDRTVKDESNNNWWNARQKFFEDPANRAKQEALNLRFAELQVKYQKQLITAVPAKADRIKNQSPSVTLFSYLGN